MTTLTSNLFHGQGPTDHRLDVVEGHWPDDVTGAVYIVGPDKRAPGGHWFAEPGLVERIRLTPDRDGRIAVEHRVIDTPLQRIKSRLRFLFRRIGFVELSPFGVTNLANTNVQVIGDRMFVGYDAGRPIEIDPVTLRFITPVGSNGEWLQAAPGLYEPLCAVAAHPASDHREQALYFVNYTQIAAPGVPKETWIARWPLDGPVQRWRVSGMSPFDSIHAVAVTEHHVVFTDLPFVVEPQTFLGKPRTTRNQTDTALWIVPKAELRTVPPGATVTAREVRIPMPSGHVYADHAEVDGRLRVVLQHIPLADLMIMSHGDHEGLITLTVQPSVIGRYEIDPTTGEVLDASIAMDERRVWGGVLPATDVTSEAARARQHQLWYASAGHDPELIPDEWWALYGSATDGVVAPADLPDHPIPGSLARFDLEAMKVAEVWTYDGGAFPSPPTFVPRVGAEDPDDGYIVVVVHQDGDKEVQVFDAMHVEAGPLARATAPNFHPGLLLHSCWTPDRIGPRPSRYRVSTWRDVLGAIRGLPGVFANLARMAIAMRTRPERT